MARQRFCKDLHEAVELNKVERVDKILSENIKLSNPLKCTNELNLILREAVRSGNLELVDTLLKNGVELEDLESNMIIIFDNQGETCKKMLTLLLKYGLNVGFHNDRGQNFLHQFICQRRSIKHQDFLAIVEILLNSGIPIDEMDDMQGSPLVYSVCLEEFEITSFLLSKGADPNQQPPLSPLHLAMMLRNREILDLLLSNGVDVSIRSSSGQTLLHEACYLHCDFEVELLLAKSADVNAKDEIENTPFSLLRPEVDGYDECMKLMVKEFSKMIFQNIPVSSQNMELIRIEPRAREYFEKCTGELEEMRSTRFYAPFSYYSVLSKTSMKKLANFMKNEEFVLKFNEGMVKFSHYDDQLRKIFDEAMDLRNKSMDVLSRLYGIFSDVLPDIVIRKLVDELSLEDLPLN